MVGSEVFIYELQEILSLEFKQNKQKRHIQLATILP